MNVGAGGSNSQEVDLNLAPIIDCFTVLIAFMLASASFIAVGILDAGVAAGGAAATDSKPPSVSIAVELQEPGKFVVKVTGKATQTLSAKSDGELAGHLQSLKGRWPDVSALTLTAGDAIQYQEVVKTMDMARKTHPAVLLGGF